MKGLVAEIFQNERPSFLHVTTMSRSPKGNYSCENIDFFVKKCSNHLNQQMRELLWLEACLYTAGIQTRSILGTAIFY